MDRWRGKIAVVTGSSAGIGLAISKALLRRGMIVVGLARGKNKMLDSFKNEANAKNFFAKECDVSDPNSVKEAFDYIKNTFQIIDVLVNNAGVLKLKSFQECSIDDLQQVININLMGVIYCSKEATKLMKEIGNEAHVININSIAGLKVAHEGWLGGNHFNVYSSSKFGVTAFSEILMNDLMGHKIRVTNLSPGFVSTDLFNSHPDVMDSLSTCLSAEDVADSVVYVLETPPHVQITQLTIKPLGEKC